VRPQKIVKNSHFWGFLGGLKKGQKTTFLGVFEKVFLYGANQNFGQKRRFGIGRFPPYGGPGAQKT
jgi:hypothetical protein